MFEELSADSFPHRNLMFLTQIFTWEAKLSKGQLSDW